MKLPPYNPKLDELTLLREPEKKIIESMMLYSGLTGTELQGTGVRWGVGSVVNVEGLNQNESYSFSCMGIGEDHVRKIFFGLFILYIYSKKGFFFEFLFIIIFFCMLELIFKYFILSLSMREHSIYFILIRKGLRKLQEKRHPKLEPIILFQ
jgi:hypothetical protein